MPNLYVMPIDQALKLKWEVGRENYRINEDEPFAGNPLKEAHNELLDLLNYLKVVREMNMVEDVEQLKAVMDDARVALVLVRRWIRVWEAM